MHRQNVHPTINWPIACAEYLNLHVKQLCVHLSTGTFCMPKSIICAPHFVRMCADFAGATVSSFFENLAPLSERDVFAGRLQ